MNQVELQVAKGIEDVFTEIFGVSPGEIKLETTKPEFKGQLTLVVFPYLRLTKLSPLSTAEKIGAALLEKDLLISEYQPINGFLNLTLKPSLWIEWLELNFRNPSPGKSLQPSGKKVMVEYSSPNTNKPQHLGHVRNNLLGAAVSNILAYNGHEVFKANLINDRGIHICKSMIAWVQFGNGKTPASTGIKGDHFVGDYYVLFDKKYKSEIEVLVSEGMDQEKAEKEAPIMKAASEMLLQWEQGNPEIIAIWKTMNGWVYDGFESTYNRMGIHFDKRYFESETYLLGKEVVAEGLAKNVFYKKDDGSVWINLEDKGLDQKLLLRKDGTSVYMTQDLGTADLKYKDFPYDESIYVVGNEQDYHFKALKAILEKLEKPYASAIQHLSYGMIDLPTGKMKSREGTVVDADDLMDEMEATAKELAQTLGKIGEMSEQEQAHLYRIVGLGALKYFLLKINPEKRMVFNPQESIDFQGNTGSFLQYTYARMASILRNAPENWDTNQLNNNIIPLEVEIKLIQQLANYTNTIEKAARELNPAEIANELYETARIFNQFYHQAVILKEPEEAIKKFRLALCLATKNNLKSGLNLLGIETLERM